MVKLMTGWLFGMVFGIVVPWGFAVPCWCWLVLPPVVGLLGLLCHAHFPEFSLVMPLRWFDVVAVPLLPEERRKGLAVWFVFLVVTAAVLFFPMLLPTNVQTPDTQPARWDNRLRLSFPTTGKKHER